MLVAGNNDSGSTGQGATNKLVVGGIFSHNHRSASGCYGVKIGQYLTIEDTTHLIAVLYILLFGVPTKRGKNHALGFWIPTVIFASAPP